MAHPDKDYLSQKDKKYLRRFFIVNKNDEKISKFNLNFSFKYFSFVLKNKMMKKE